MTLRRVSRVGEEVLHQTDSPPRRVSRVGEEVLHQTTGPPRRVSRVGEEILHSIEEVVVDFTGWGIPI